MQYQGFIILCVWGGGAKEWSQWSVQDLEKRSLDIISYHKIYEGCPSKSSMIFSGCVYILMGTILYKYGWNHSLLDGMSA